MLGDKINILEWDEEKKTLDIDVNHFDFLYKDDNGIIRPTLLPKNWSWRGGNRKSNKNKSNNKKYTKNKTKKLKTKKSNNLEPINKENLIIEAENILLYKQKKNTKRKKRKHKKTSKKKRN